MENREEQERRELNKRLLGRTVKSELQEKRKVVNSEMLVDFVVLFVVLFAAEAITNWLAVESWLIELGIAVLVGIPMFALKSRLKMK